MMMRMICKRCKCQHAWQLTVQYTATDSCFRVCPAKKLAKRGMSKKKSQILAANSPGSMSREGKSMKKRVVSMLLAGMMVLGNAGTVLAAEESVAPVQSEVVESQVESPAEETKEQASETEEAAQDETESEAPAEETAQEESKTEEAAPAEEAAQSQTEEAVALEGEASLVDTQDDTVTSDGTPAAVVNPKDGRLVATEDTEAAQQKLYNFLKNITSVK